MQPVTRPDLESSAEFDAPPEAVWAVVSDVTRTPEWSPVVHRSVWIGDPAAPVEGARFRGDNRFNGFRWSRECVVTQAEPHRVFAFSTTDRRGREQTRWRYRLERSSGGTTVTLDYEVVTTPRWVRVLASLPGTRQVSDRQARQNLGVSLERLRELVHETPQ
jgi:uncharacterized protein YndB with AHSA1/START domain